MMDNEPAAIISIVLLAALIIFGIVTYIKDKRKR